MQIKRGTTRTVLLVGPYAVKLPSGRSWRLFLHGLLGNQQEALWWRELKEPKARLTMCPVLFYIPGGWMLIMPRCKPISRSLWLKARLCSRMKRQGIPVENKPCSFGWLKDRVVAVDYGS